MKKLLAVILLLGTFSAMASKEVCVVDKSEDGAEISCTDGYQNKSYKDSTKATAEYVKYAMTKNYVLVNVTQSKAGVVYTFLKEF